MAAPHIAKGVTYLYPDSQPGLYRRHYLAKKKLDENPALLRNWGLDVANQAERKKRYGIYARGLKTNKRRSLDNAYKVSNYVYSPYHQEMVQRHHHTTCDPEYRKIQQIRSEYPHMTNDNLRELLSHFDARVRNCVSKKAGLPDEVKCSDIAMTILEKYRFPNYTRATLEYVIDKHLGKVVMNVSMKECILQKLLNSDSRKLLRQMRLLNIKTRLIHMEGRRRGELENLMTKLERNAGRNGSPSKPAAARRMPRESLRKSAVARWNATVYRPKNNLNIRIQNAWKIVRRNPKVLTRWGFQNPDKLKRRSLYNRYSAMYAPGTQNRKTLNAAFDLAKYYHKYNKPRV